MNIPSEGTIWAQGIAVSVWCQNGSEFTEGEKSEKNPIWVADFWKAGQAFSRVTNLNLQIYYLCIGFRIMWIVCLGIAIQEEWQIQSSGRAKRPVVSPLGIIPITNKWINSEIYLLSTELDLQSQDSKWKLIYVSVRNLWGTSPADWPTGTISPL